MFEDRFKEFVADGGTHTEQTLRKIGAMAPTTALHGLIYGTIGAGAGSQLGALGVLGAAALPIVAGGAKTLAKSKQGARNQAFQKEMQGNARPANVGTAANGGMLTGPLANEYNNEQNRLNEIRRKQRSAAR